MKNLKLKPAHERAKTIPPELDIYIKSGEGEGPYTFERYTGARTVRAIKTRLTNERCGGDRKAWAVVKAKNPDNDALPWDRWRWRPLSDFIDL
jgi:hypothetical protein